MLPIVGKVGGKGFGKDCGKVDCKDGGKVRGKVCLGISRHMMQRAVPHLLAIGPAPLMDPGQSPVEQ